MKKILAIALTLGFCLVLALVAGCSQQAAPAATPTPTTVATTEATVAPTSAPTTSSDSLTPGGVETLPEIWSIEMQVRNNGEAVNPMIITTFNGGKGMNVVPEIDITVTRSDGVVENDRMVQPLYKGKEIDLAGTTANKDRVEIWVITPNSEKVKIYDAYVPFRSYN
jgi:PBP1b-binding outer membrane lipoprotein LpoB